MAEVYDVIILGGGPAGLTAALYTCRSRLRTLLIERGLFGGQITMAERVDNFPGFPEGINGGELGERMHQQAVKYGLETLTAEVAGVSQNGGLKTVSTGSGSFLCNALIIALGAEHRRLGVVGEEVFLGKGVSYCAYCDAPFFTEEPVAVVGGGNTAVTDALYVARYASRVFLIHRRRQLRAETILQEMAFAEPKLEVLWDSVVEAVEGETQVQGLRLRRVDTGEGYFLPVGGVFVAIGTQPNTGFLGPLLELTPEGHIVTGPMMETSVPGIFAAGDVRHHAIRQAIACAGDGATAALAAVHYLQQQRS